ncbi:ankyrin repeat domain-containing protein [bacterium]|nr:ankyrin repeat domain-containing protein [bacterium]
MHRKFLPSLLLSFALISCWIAVSIYVQSQSGGTSFSAGTGLSRFKDGVDFSLSTGVTLFIFSIFQILIDFKLKGSKALAILLGVFLPPFAAFFINVIPLLLGGPLRGDATLLILLPFIAAQSAITLIPIWITYGLILNSIAKDSTSKSAWLKATGALSLLAVIVIALFGFSPKSERPFELIREGNAVELEKLLVEGLSPNIVDKEGISLLHYGVFHGSLDVVRVLLEHGADTEYKSFDRNTALSYVGPYEDELFDLVLKHSKNVAQDEQSFWNALNNNNLERVKKLIAAGQRVHLLRSEEVIRMSIDKNSLEMLKLLLDSGADPNSSERYSKRTPLMLAAGAGKIEFVKILLEKGADPELKDKDGRTAKDYSKYSNSDEVKALLESLS